MRKPNIGDYITFTATTREGRKKVRRRVNGFDFKGFPTVRYFGWNDFSVGGFPRDRIHKVETAAQVARQV